jgi:RND family efflux transporter MFP subunit
MNRITFEACKVCVWSILLAGVFLVGCKKGEQPRAASARAGEVVPVALQPVQVQPTQRYVEVNGTLYGDEETTVAAKVAGRVREIKSDIGDRVLSGEVLCELDRTDYDLAVKQKELAILEALAKLGLDKMPPVDFDVSKVPTVVRSRLQAENAEGKLMRGKQLHDQSPPLLSDQDFADLQTAVDVAHAAYDVELLGAKALLAEARSRQADLNVARQQLDDAVIRVPIPQKTRPATQPSDTAWEVSARLVSAGEYVKEGAPVYKLVDDDFVKLRALVPERHLSEVHTGQKVELSVEAYAEPVLGALLRINPQVDIASRTFQVEVLVQNSQHLLKAGSFVKAKIYTRVEPDVLFVPEKAVVTFAGISRVYVVRDGKSMDVTFEPGLRHDGLVEVARVTSKLGLVASDAVIVDGVNRVAVGSSVRVLEPHGGGVPVSLQSR